MSKLNNLPQSKRIGKYKDTGLYVYLFHQYQSSKYGLEFKDIDSINIKPLIEVISKYLDKIHRIEIEPHSAYRSSPYAHLMIFSDFDTLMKIVDDLTKQGLLEIIQEPKKIHDWYRKVESTLMMS